MAKNIILLATYWNEIDWIYASLRQIDKIDPVETIICEGFLTLPGLFTPLMEPERRSRILLKVGRTRR